MALLKKIPDAENGARVTCVDAAGQTWIISQNHLAPPARCFTLYRVEKNGFERIETAPSPLDLYAKIDFGPEVPPANDKTTSSDPKNPDAKPDKPRATRKRASKT